MHKVRIEYWPMYTCTQCQRVERGTSKRLLEWSGDLLHEATQLQEIIKKQKAPAHLMPLGWANSYNTGFVCWNCK